MAWDAAVPLTWDREGEYGGGIHCGGSEPEATIERDGLGTPSLAGRGDQFRQFDAPKRSREGVAHDLVVVFRVITGDDRR